MVKYPTLTALFSAIANSLRSKTGTTGTIVADDFPSVIDGISTGVEGGIIPTGTKSITSNGTHDVRTYESAEVNVPIPDGYIKPSGAKSITSNGTHDVTNYASATVNVPTGITPTGTKTISSNGEHDVAQFASANVAVQGLNARAFTATVASDVTSGNFTLFQANDFLKSIRNSPTGFVWVFKKGYYSTGTQMMTMWVISNMAFTSNNGANARTALIVRNSTSAASCLTYDHRLTTTTSSSNLNLGEDGSLSIRGITSYPVLAGEYGIIAGTMENL